MASEFQTIWRHGRIYGLGSMINRLSSLLLIPILLHNITAEAWGVYVLILLVGNFLVIIPSALNDTMNPLYFEREDEARRRRVVATTLGLYAIFATVFLLLTYPLAVLTGALMFDQQTYLIPLLLALISVAFEVLFEIELDYLRARKRSGLFIALSCFRSVTQLGLGIALVVVLHMGITGVVIGHLVSYLLVALPTAVYVIRQVGFGLDRAIAREMFTMAGPLVPAWFAKASLELVERALLNVMVSTAVMGVYAFGSKLVVQLRPLFSAPFADIWSVRLLEVAANPERAPEFNRVFVFFIAALATAALGIALYAPELVRLLAAEGFWDARLVVPLLALSYLARPSYYHFERLIIQSKRTSYLALVNWLTVGAAVIALVILVPPFGLLGAAMAEFATRLVRLALAVWSASRCSKLTALFPWQSFAMVVAGAVACYLLSAAILGTEMGLIATPAKMAFAALFLLWVLHGPCLKPDEREAVRRTLAEKLGRLRGRLAGSTGA